MKNNRIAIIAAGGNGSRMNSQKPKALRTYNNTSYLSILLQELSKIQLDTIIIFCNRLNYIHEVIDIAKPYSNIQVIVDEGKKSTFELFNKGLSIYPDSEILFFYGHSPRSKVEIEKILDLKASCVVSLYNKSTKANTTIMEKGFIEPPFKIHSSNFDFSKITNWNDFFIKEQNKIKGIYYNSPSEFNYSSEEKLYQQYIATWNNKYIAA